MSEAYRRHQGLRRLHLASNAPSIPPDRVNTNEQCVHYYIFEVFSTHSRHIFRNGICFPWPKTRLLWETEAQQTRMFDYDDEFLCADGMWRCWKYCTSMKSSVHIYSSKDLHQHLDNKYQFVHRCPRAFRVSLLPLFGAKDWNVFPRLFGR